MKQAVVSANHAVTGWWVGRLPGSQDTVTPGADEAQRIEWEVQLMLETFKGRMNRVSPLNRVDAGENQS